MISTVKNNWGQTTINGNNNWGQIKFNLLSTIQDEQYDEHWAGARIRIAAMFNFTLTPMKNNRGQTTIIYEFQYVKCRKTWSVPYYSPYYSLLFDELGNGKKLDGTIIGEIGNATNMSNVVLATPFALSVLLPPDVWNAVFAVINSK